MRGAAFALVVAALALLVLKPFCDLAFASSGDANSSTVVATAAGHAVAGHPGTEAPEAATCCATVSDATLINSAKSLVPRMPDVSLGAAFILLAGLVPVAGPRNAAKFGLAAPPERSFYVRSARILR